ncbi:transcriptional regulator [Prauserella marina]|nr:transcriptional regulator [Prauserella marina]
MLAEPRRRQILDLLLKGDQPAGAIVDHIDVSQPTVSRHLAVLRRAGLVTVRGKAQQRWYHLEAAPLRSLDDWLTPYRARWADRLAALGDYLDDMPDE